MDGNRFDELTKQLGASSSRRTVLRGLAGGLAAALGWSQVTQARCSRDEPIRCGTDCVNLRTDPEHCGRCNNACAASQVCYAGRCGDTCPTGFTRLHDTCVRTCPAGMFACGGQCISTCTPLSECHDVGECDPFAQACTNPVKALWSPCGNDGQCCNGACYECSPGFNVKESGGTCQCIVSCFTADTRIAMADGTSKPIAEILVGDHVIGQHGQINQVLNLKPTVLGARPLYALNDGAYFVTAEHPFMTDQGWKAIDPEQSARRHPGLAVGRLSVGDRVLELAGVAIPVGAGGTPLDDAVETRVTAIPLERISAMIVDAETPLYNLHVDNNHTYFANDLLVHNKI